MRVILRIVRDKAVAGRVFFRQIVLQTDKVTIGSDADQIVQVRHPRLAAAHAVIEIERGVPRLRVLAPLALPVNGVAQRLATLARGDVVGLGFGRLSVQDIRRNDVLVLRLDLPNEKGLNQGLARAALTLKDAGIRAAPASLLLSAGVVLLLLLVPLLTAWQTPLQSSLRASSFVPSDAMWQPGTLHKAHQSLGNNCNACHLQPFQKVEDRACIACHKDTQHHVPADSPARAVFEARRCADCHIEHAHPTRLVERDPAACTECHADLKRLDPAVRVENATNFGHDHPEFALAMLQPPQDGSTDWPVRMVYPEAGQTLEEHSNLKFSHKVHLDPAGIKSPSGDRKLTCGDCHQADASGRQMQPIRMETHCASCHSLQFDEHDPSTAVPHGALQPMYAAIEAHFSRMFLKEKGGLDGASRRRPGGETAVLSREEQRRALAWTSEQSLQAVRELLEKRVCVECHVVEKKPGGTGLDLWQVLPVKLAERWMPRAEFSHAAHRSSTCVACHTDAEHSEHSSDVLLPTIKQCRECHGGSHDTGRLASDCLMCHQLHVAGRGPMVAADPKP